MEKFRKLKLSEGILKAIGELGFEDPSEIQEKAIPLILEGRDVLGSSATGSGKTLAFGAGIIDRIEGRKGIQALVLTPTRELAEQVAQSLRIFSRWNGLFVKEVYGGVSMSPQIRDLSRAEIVVGTPGRILDHLERGTLKLGKVKFLILDEADRMLEMGFIEDVEKIIGECSNKRQTLLFSATISKDVISLSRKYMINPVGISAESYVDPKKLKQVFYDVEDNVKFSLLKHLLENENSGLVMIFCNTRKNVDFVSKNLSFMGLDVVPIHGGFSQEKRNRFLSMFNSEKSKVKILIATDVAARGLDIKNVTHIYNYDIPLSKNEYIHRIGRTARAGKEGKVINILTPRYYDNFQDIIQDKEFNIEEENTPYVNKVRIRWMPEKKNERMRRRSRFNKINNKARGTRPNWRNKKIRSYRR